MHTFINGLTWGLRRYADDWDEPRQRAPSARKLKMYAHIRSCVEKISKCRIFTVENSTLRWLWDPEVQYGVGAGV